MAYDPTVTSSLFLLVGVVTTTAAAVWTACLVGKALFRWRAAATEPSWDPAPSEDPELTPLEGSGRVMELELDDDRTQPADPSDPTDRIPLTRTAGGGAELTDAEPSGWEVPLLLDFEGPDTATAVVGLE